MMGIRLGRGLAERAEAAIRERNPGKHEASFDYANATYMAIANGPPEQGGTYCGGVEVAGVTYSVYLLPE
jgi:hypothetical protein